MEKIFYLFADGIASGGPGAIILLLIGVIAVLIWDRLGLIKSMNENSTLYRADINKVIDKYQEGQINVIQALNDIKLILVKVEAKV
jgi:hypothetical protein